MFLCPIESVYERLNLPRVWSALVRLPCVLAFLLIFIEIVLIILGVSWVFNNNDNNNNIVRAKNGTHFQGNCCLTVGTQPVFWLDVSNDVLKQWYSRTSPIPLHVYAIVYVSYAFLFVVCLSIFLLGQMFREESDSLWWFTLQTVFSRSGLGQWFGWKAKELERLEGLPCRVECC